MNLRNADYLSEIAKTMGCELTPSQITRSLDLLADEAKSSVLRLTAALGDESGKLTRLMDNTHALLTTLTSDAAKDLPPLLKMAINGFLRVHPEVAPK